MRSTKRLSNAAPVAMRMALAAGFLSAVGGRFGLWGAVGPPGGAWGGVGQVLGYNPTNLPLPPAPPLAGGVVGRVRQVPGLYRNDSPLPADHARGGCRLGGDRGRDLAGRRTPRRRARSPGRARQRSPASHLRHRHDDRARPRGAAVVLSLDGGGRSLLAGPGPAGRVPGAAGCSVNQTTQPGQRQSWKLFLDGSLWIRGRAAQTNIRPTRATDPLVRGCAVINSPCQRIAMATIEAWVAPAAKSSLVRQK